MWQRAAKRVVAPIVEADCVPVRDGFRPKRSAPHALEALREAGNQGDTGVVDADLPADGDSLDQGKRMERVGRRVSDRRGRKLIRQWLKAGVLADGTVPETLAGTPQGGVLSPRLSTLSLNAFDRVGEPACKSRGLRVRYADDFVVRCQPESQAQEAYRRIQEHLGRLDLKRNGEKTRGVD